jgi:hypothetical protein
MEAKRHGARVGFCDLVDTNLRGTVIIDMDNDDYTMTHAECMAQSKAVINVGDGTKTLTIPEAHDADVPGIQTFVTAFAGAAFIVEQESSTVNVELDPVEAALYLVPTVIGTYISKIF